jgi:hypothetical protein
MSSGIWRVGVCRADTGGGAQSAGVANLYQGGISEKNRKSLALVHGAKGGV